MGSEKLQILWKGVLSGLHAIHYRGGFDSSDARRILTSTSRTHAMDVPKGGEPVLNGTENNVKDLNTFR